MVGRYSGCRPHCSNKRGDIPDAAPMYVWHQHQKGTVQIGGATSQMSPLCMRGSGVRIVHAPTLVISLQACQAFVESTQLSRVPRAFGELSVNRTQGELDRTINNAIGFYGGSVRKSVNIGKSLIWDRIILVSTNTRHKHLCMNLIAGMLESKVKTNPSYKAKCKGNVNVFNQYNYEVSYHIAWNVIKRVVDNVYGTWETSCQYLPKFMRALQRYNPRTIVEWCHAEQEPTTGVFTLGYVFWAFKP
ncbi:hypothetical protein ACS0TY_010488 [Phlomoides rotata]